MSIKSIRTGWTGISANAGNPIIGDFESIQTYTVAASTTVADITFSSIPASYQHLQIRYLMRNGSTTTSRMRVQLNSDTGSNYAIHLLEGDGSVASSAAGASQSNTLGSGTTASSFSGFVGGIIDILDYTNTNKNTTLRSLSGHDRNGAGDISLWSGLWINTGVVNTIKLFIPTLSFGEYSHFALYGIR